MSKISQDRLRQLLDYDPVSGVFSRKGNAYWLRPHQPVGTLDGEGYRVIRLDGRAYKAHRLAFFWMTGAWPAKFIDHVNMKKDDNSWENLREATPSQNKANSEGWRKKIGPKGVYRRGRRFRAAICVDGKLRYLGTFDTEIEASKAYARSAHDSFGPFARVS
jgi:hypothetical protein